MHDLDSPAAATSSSSSPAGAPAEKKLARQLDFTVSGARGGGSGGGLMSSTTASMLQTQHMRVPLPRSQFEKMRTAAMPQMPLMPHVQQAQSHHLTTTVWPMLKFKRFFSILKTLIVFKGGISKTYKKFIEEKITLQMIHIAKRVQSVQGFDPYNMQVVQVDHVELKHAAKVQVVLETTHVVLVIVTEVAVVETILKAVLENHDNQQVHHHHHHDTLHDH